MRGGYTLEDNKSFLFKEYELCQNSTQKIEDNIWKTFSAIGIIAVGPLTIISTTEISKISVLLILISGFFVVSTTWIWWGMASRWWDIQHITFGRMSDIENELKCIYQIRYIKYKDGQLDVNESSLSAEQKLDLQMDSEIKKKGVQKSLGYFPLLITIVWILFTLYMALRKLNGGSFMICNHFIQIVSCICVFIGGVGIGVIVALTINRSRYREIHNQYMELLRSTKIKD